MRARSTRTGAARYEEVIGFYVRGTSTMQGTVTVTRAQLFALLLLLIAMPGSQAPLSVLCLRFSFRCVRTRTAVNLVPGIQVSVRRAASIRLVELGPSTR